MGSIVHRFERPVFEMAHILRRIFCILAILPIAAAASPNVARPRDPSVFAAAEQQAKGDVSVFLALTTKQIHRVPWRPGLTIDAAILAAGDDPGVRWKEAWRHRKTFWGRTFRNPHSFWARLLAGDKAFDVVYFSRVEGNGRKARLKPGDEIYVDLAPIL